jgi:hypothetical protein
MALAASFTVTRAVTLPGMSGGAISILETSNCAGCRRAASNAARNLLFSTGRNWSNRITRLMVRRAVALLSRLVPPCRFLRCCSSIRDSIRLTQLAPERRFRAEMQVMTPEPGSPESALVRAWRAIVRAFTPAAQSRGPHHYGADTTLFGGATEQPRGRRRADGTGDEFWGPAGDSTDFADLDPDGEPRRRR